MGRKRKSPATQAALNVPTEARDAQEEFDREPSRREPTAAGNGQGSEKMSYQELVKAALDAGHDTAKVAVPWIRERFGGRVPEKFNENSFNTTKSILKKKAGGGVAPTAGRRGGRRKKAEAAPAAAPVRQAPAPA